MIEALIALAYGAFMASAGFLFGYLVRDVRADDELKAEERERILAEKIAHAKIRQALKSPGIEPFTRV